MPCTLAQIAMKRESRAKFTDFIELELAHLEKPAPRECFTLRQRLHEGSEELAFTICWQPISVSPKPHWNYVLPARIRQVHFGRRGRHQNLMSLHLNMCENQANKHTYYGDSEAEEEMFEERFNEAELNFPASCETLLFRMLQMVATFSMNWDQIKHYPFTTYEAYLNLQSLIVLSA